MTKTVSVSLRVSEEIQAQVQAIAKREEIPASYVLRRLIKAGLVQVNKAQKNVPEAPTELPEDWNE